MLKVLCNKDDKQVKKVCYSQDKGAIMYEVPAFNYLFETVIEDAYTDKTWKENGSDSANYRIQMDIAKKRFVEEAQHNQVIRSQCTEEELNQIDKGKFPDTLTAHHDRTSGNNAKDSVMQIVRREEHQARPHKGGSAMANPKIRERDYITNYGDQTAIQTLMDKTEYTVIKHPVATSVAVGGVAACVSNFLIRKFGLSGNKALFVSCCFGMIAGVGTLWAISDYSKNIYIGD